MKLKPEYQDLEKENEILRKKLRNIKKDKKFDNYFDYNKSIMLQIDSDTKMIFKANEAAVNFYGYLKQELLQKSINDLNILPLEEINTLMKKAVKNKSNFFEFQHKLANGKIKDVEIYASPYSVDDKIHMILTIIDISNRKKTEKELKDQNEEYESLNEETKTINEDLSIAEEKYRNWFEYFPHATFIWEIIGDDFEMVRANKKAYEESNGKVEDVFRIKSRVLWENEEHLSNYLFECYETKKLEIFNKNTVLEVAVKSNLYQQHIVLYLPIVFR